MWNNVFSSIVYQVHRDYVTKYHYIAIIPLITENGNVEFIWELKGSHRQENLFFKIDYWLKNVSQEFYKPLSYVIITYRENWEWHNQATVIERSSINTL
jgi:hypothetical protein